MGKDNKDTVKTRGSAAREIILQSMKKDYPALFATPEVENQFKAAADMLVTKTAGASRTMHLMDAFQNLRNYALNSVEVWEEGFKNDPSVLGDYDKALKEHGLGKLVVEHMRLSYFEFLNAFLDIAEGTTFNDPATCDCEHHRSLREGTPQKKGRIPVISAEDMSDADMDAVINDTKGTA